MSGQIPNPYLVGGGGPHALLSARVCRVLDVELGAELARLRTRSRGVDQEVAYALIAVREAAMSAVLPEEQAPVESTEHAPGLVTWISGSEAADLLGVGPRAVYQAIARDRLPAVKSGREWRIRRSDLDDYRARRAA